MRKICIVTNYNYGNFLHECLMSLVMQSVGFDKIIVIDDGSSDNSVNIINEYCNKYDNFYLFSKTNGGQLSCFNHVSGEIESNDIIFFIDSDDFYFENYVSEVVDHYEKSKAEFIFVEPVEFNDGEKINNSVTNSKVCTFFFESTSSITRRTYCWIGNPTSCISITGSLYLKLFPYPYEEEWKSRADDVIVYGSSIIGTRKLYIESPLVAYRIHDKNIFATKKITISDISWRNLSLEKLFRWYSNKAMLSSRGSVRCALNELKLIPVSYRKKFSIPGKYEIFFGQFFD